MRRALVVALLLGCKIDGSIGRDEPKGGGEGGGTEAVAESGATDPGDGGTTQGTAGGSGGSNADGAPTTSGAEGGRETSGSDVPAACVPTPDDGECTSCRKHNCCAPLVACLGNDGCICWWECLHSDHTPAECEAQCTTGGALYDELLHCQNAHCDACL